MRRVVVLGLVLALALVGPGCAKQDAYTRGDTEGLYLAADGLKYQIQLSRELNPSLVEDRALLRGIPASERRLKRDELWFGVWLRVENDGKGIHRSSDNFEITDTQGNHYEPVTVNPAQNILTYHPQTLGPSSLYPNVDSVAAQCCAREGALLIFKLNQSVYQNRPAEFAIRTTNVPLRTEASVQLDL